MKIITLTRKVSNAEIPDTFIIGHPPFQGGNVIEGPLVSDIKYFSGFTTNSRFMPGPMYKIFFENSDVTRLIPTDAVIDVGVQNTEEKKKLGLEEEPVANVEDVQEVIKGE